MTQAEHCSYAWQILVMGEPMGWRCTLPKGHEGQHEDHSNPPGCASHPRTTSARSGEDT